MGRRPIVRRRGRSPKFRAHTFRRVAPARYPAPDLAVPVSTGKVLALVHDPGRGSPLALMGLQNGTKFFTLAPEGMYVGQEVSVGNKSSANTGDIAPLSAVPEGAYVCNVERTPGDGGALFRSSGNYALLVGKAPDGASLKDAKGRLFYLQLASLATLGVIAGGGRMEKPFLKAGTRLKQMRSRGRLYPIVRGVAMAAVHHPHGGGRHQHVGGPSSVSRNLPPGAKVGLIAPRRTGRGR